MAKRLNRLADETSPYLLQHADNPVDWYPWCEEALRRAREEDKPIFLSIGYSACHWCHVMEHECFEDEEIAKIMNEHYINIKVDREERPDIDDVYQRVCQLVTGTGGWPLSVFLTPDLKPFYVGTYFPKEDRYGLPGFPRLLRYLAELYRNDREKINRQVEMIMNGLNMLEFKPKTMESASMDLTLLDEAALHLLDDADMVNGGFGGAPKFPNAMNLMFLLRYYRMKGISRFLNFVLLTLNKMRDGGIHDHIGGGFHRYAVDARWMVPHFEKMLYDNALLAVLYAEAYQVSKDNRYVEVMRDILDYVLREMTSSEHGFCSSQDADSEGEEGKYYTWSMDEVRRLIGDREDAEIFSAYYGMSEQGNFDGKNILHVSMSIDTLASRFNKSRDEVKAILERCRRLLFDARASRVRPARDDKIILAWNALMISAMVKGYKISGDERYLDSALGAVGMIEARMSRGSRLKRIYKDGIAKVDAYLDDYSSYINALLDLFEVVPKSIYLDRAVVYTEHMLQHFWDTNSNDDIYYTSDEHEQLILRVKSPYDLSTPSGNSMGALALIRLYHYTHRGEYISKAENILKRYSIHAAENPFAYGNMLNVLYIYLRKPVEVTMITNVRDDGVRGFWAEFVPECIAVVASKDELDMLAGIPFFTGKLPVEGKSLTAYVCKGLRCSLPLHDVEEVRRYILEEAQV